MVAGDAGRSLASTPASCPNIANRVRWWEGCERKWQPSWAYPPKTQVCTGALDQACGAIGVGNIQPGIFSENTGAALAICASVREATLDPADQMPCHYHGLPGLYMLHTFTSGGIVLRWFRDEFAQMEMSVGKASGMDAYDLLGAEAAKVPAGCEGLVMLPHLQGAMAPEANPDAKGVFYGFTLRHGREPLHHGPSWRPSVLSCGAISR